MLIEFVTLDGLQILGSDSQIFPRPVVGDVVATPDNKVYQVTQCSFVAATPSRLTTKLEPRIIGEPVQAEVKMQCIVVELDKKMHFDEGGTISADKSGTA